MGVVSVIWVEKVLILSQSNTHIWMNAFLSNRYVNGLRRGTTTWIPVDAYKCTHQFKWLGFRGDRYRLFFPSMDPQLLSLERQSEHLLLHMSVLQSVNSLCFRVHVFVCACASVLMCARLCLLCMSVSACISSCLSLCVRMRACVLAWLHCVHVCLRACVHACVWVRACVS